MVRRIVIRVYCRRGRRTFDGERRTRVRLSCKGRPPCTSYDALPALARARGMRRAHCRRHPARGRGLARVARAGASRRLERIRRHRHLPFRRPARPLADADPRGLRRARRRGRPRLRHRFTPHQGQPGDRARRRHRRTERAHPLDARMGDELQRPAARVRDRSACDADRRRRSRVRARRDGTSRRARREERPGALGKRLRRRLQCLRADLGHGRRAPRRRRSPDLPRRRRARRQGDRPRQAHRQGDLARAVVEHRARLQPADHHQRRRRAAADPLSSRGLQFARPGDGQGVLGNRTPRADGDRRRDAGAQRTLPVLHVAARRRPHARAGRAQTRRGPAVERSGRAGSRHDARHAQHGELGDQHTGHRRRLRVRARQRRSAAMPGRPRPARWPGRPTRCSASTRCTERRSS